MVASDASAIRKDANIEPVVMEDSDDGFSIEGDNSRESHNPIIEEIKQDA